MTWDERAEAMRRHWAETGKRKLQHLEYISQFPEFSREMIVKCPMRNQDGSEIAADDIPGCGSNNVVWDGVECYDCVDCGIFFAPWAADPPHRRKRDPESEGYQDVDEADDCCAGEI